MGIHDNVYNGRACVGMVTVLTDNQMKYLPNRTDLKNYTPDAGVRHPADHFDWGCDSPACYQLGLSILAYEFGDDIAMKKHKDFTEKYICALDEEESWEMDSDDLERMLMRMAS